MEEHDEFLAAEPHHSIGAAHGRAQLRRDALEHDVTDCVPAAVVDGLEVVEVDEQQ